MRIDLDWRPITRFRGASFLQTLIETAAGFALLLAFARLSGAATLFGFQSVFVYFAMLWLVIWPAYRLSALRGTGWKPYPLRVVRTLAMAAAAALLALAAGNTVYPGIGVSIHTGKFVAIAIGFLVFRLIAVLAAALLWRASHRLRWQLLASHVAVILLMVIALTSFGSAVGVALLDRGLRPDAVASARSIAQDIQLSSPGRVTVQSANSAISRVYARKLLLNGAPVLSAIDPRPFLPTAIAVVGTDARVVTGQERIKDANRPIRAGSNVPGLTRTQTTGLIHQVENSGSGIFDVPTRGSFGGTYGIARIGSSSDFVILDEPDTSIASGQYFHAVVALFGVSTIAIILLISVPMLALSFVFSYFIARSLTRRFESVSAVTAALASGDLSRRAEVTSRNEVGQLAADVNEMAARLERTVTELREARADAEEALQQRRELVANVSHELRTPLAILMAHLEPALEESASSDGRVSLPGGTLQALRREAERLQSLIDDLFALSRADSRSIDLRLEKLDPHEVVSEVVALMRPLALSEGSVSIVDRSPRSAPPMLADRERLQQVLANLVRNAVRHTPEGGIVALSAYARNDDAVIELSDTGTGIPAEDLPHIFDRFYRVPSESASSPGAGLGLAIVRELVERMGGEVTVESTPGEGTHFYVTFPAVEAATPASPTLVG